MFDSRLGSVGSEFTKLVKRDNQVGIRSHVQTDQLKLEAPFFKTSLAGSPLLRSLESCWTLYTD